MTLPSYRNLKPSGIEWLGEVPTHWTVARLRFHADLNPSKQELAGLALTTEVTFLPMEAVGEDGTLCLDQTRPLGELLAGYTYFAEQDVAYAKITPCFENGKGALMQGLKGGFGFGTTELTVLRAKPSASPRFIWWLTQSAPFRKLGEAAMYGAGGQQRVPDGFAKDFSPAWPPLEEQLAIATFLDRETAKIDTLIAEQRALIERLREKRQAVIAHSITTGLTPDAPRKRDQIEWLGEFPSHWTCKRLKRISPHICVGIVVNPSSYLADDGVPFIYGSDIREGGIDLEGCRKMSPASSALNAKTLLREGDLLTVRVGYPGLTAVVPKALEGGNCASVMLIRGSSDFCSQWLCHAMNSPVGRSQVEAVQYGAAQEQFNIGHAVEFLFPVPPIQEQIAIAEYIDERLHFFDGLIREAETSIALLQEHRSALITAVVTGKVDVRGAVA